MARSAAASALTDRHRQDQIRLRAVTVRDLLRLWALFDPADISTSWGRIEPAIVGLIQSRRGLSSRIAGHYIEAFRRAEEVAGSAQTILAPPLADLDIVPNLRLVGPEHALGMAHKARRPSDIAKVALTNIEGEVTRQVLNGGRETITGTVAGDRHALGYARVTDGSPCSFCAMLAGRGAVYRSEMSGGFHAHRKCGCTAEPVYSATQPLPQSADRWSDLYKQVASSVSHNTDDWAAEVRREFRRRYDAAV